MWNQLARYGNSAIDKIRRIYNQIPITWLPTRSDKEAKRYLKTEKVRSYLSAYGNIARFLPLIDTYTEETAEIRRMYRIMLRDPYVKAAMFTKVFSVASLDLQVNPASKENIDKDAAEWVQYALDHHLGGTEQLIYNILVHGLIDGFSVGEMVWDEVPRGKYKGRVYVQELKPKDSKFLILEGDSYRNVTGVQDLRSANTYHPSNFAIWSHMPLYDSPTGMSDFRSAYRAFWLIDAAWQLRAIAMERYGLPIMIGRYDGDTGRQMDLESKLDELRSQSWITLPPEVQVEALNLAGATKESEFQAAINDLREEMAVAITGASLQMLQGQVADGRGSSQVHKNTSELVQWYLRAQIQAVIYNQIVPALVEYNLPGADYPTISLGSVSDTDLEATLRVDQGLQQLGWVHSKEEIQEKYGRRLPKDKGDELQPQQQQGMGMGGMMGGMGGDMGGGMPPEGPDDPNGGGGGDTDLASLLATGKFSEEQTRAILKFAERQRKYWRSPEKINGKYRYSKTKKRGWLPPNSEHAAEGIKPKSAEESKDEPQDDRGARGARGSSKPERRWHGSDFELYGKRYALTRKEMEQGDYNGFYKQMKNGVMLFDKDANPRLLVPYKEGVPPVTVVKENGKYKYLTSATRQEEHWAGFPEEHLDQLEGVDSAFNQSPPANKPDERGEESIQDSLKRIQEQTKREREAEVQRVGEDKKELQKELKNAKSVLADWAKAKFGKGRFDFWHKRLVSDDGQYALQWKPDTTTNRGSVNFIKLDDKKNTTPPSLSDYRTKRDQVAPVDLDANEDLPAEPEQRKQKPAKPEPQHVANTNDLISRLKDGDARRLDILQHVVNLSSGKDANQYKQLVQDITGKKARTTDEADEILHKHIAKEAGRPELFSEQDVKKKLIADDPANRDFTNAEQLLERAVRWGNKALSALVRRVIERNPTHPEFLQEDRNVMTEIIARVMAPANLLGQYRVRKLAEIAEKNLEKFSDQEVLKFAEPIQPMAPKNALEYFRSLVPAWNLEPNWTDNLRKRAFTMAVTSEQTILDRVRSIIDKSLALGQVDQDQPVVQIQSVLDEAGISPRNSQYSEMVFRTNMMQAYTQGSQQAMRNPKVADLFPVWRYTGIRDGRQGKDHEVHFGKYYPASVDFDSVRGPRVYNCVLPDQHVSGRFQGASKAFYSGEAIKIHSASGGQLSVTANHPILTNRGFIPAKSIQKSDQIVCDRSDLQGLIFDEHKQHDIPLIQDVIHAFRVIEPQSLITPVSRLDFYGDGSSMDQQIDIIRPNWKLLQDWYLQATQHGCESIFFWRDMYSTSVPTLSTKALTLPWVFLPTAGIVSFNNLPLTLDGSHATPLDAFSFRMISQLNTMLDESDLNTSTARVVRLCQLINRLASNITFNNRTDMLRQGRLQQCAFSSSAQWDISFLQPSANGVAFDTELASQLRNVGAGQIFLDNIIHIERFHYDGPVYDFETDVGYFTAGYNNTCRVFLANCRCNPSPLSKFKWKRLQQNGAKLAMFSEDANVLKFAKRVDIPADGQWHDRKDRPGFQSKRLPNNRLVTKPSNSLHKSPKRDKIGKSKRITKGDNQMSTQKIVSVLRDMGASRSEAITVGDVQAKLNLPPQQLRSNLMQLWQEGKVQLDAHTMPVYVMDKQTQDNAFVYDGEIRAHVRFGSGKPQDIRIPKILMQPPKKETPQQNQRWQNKIAKTIEQQNGKAITFPALYQLVGDGHNLSQFHEALQSLEKARKIDLVPYTKTLSGLGHEEFAMIRNDDVRYAAVGWATNPTLDR